MHLKYYKLERPPFILTPDPRFLFLSIAHSRALTFMEYALLNRDGFAVISGEVGSGKTTLVSKLLTGLDADTIVAKVYQTHVDGVEFLQILLDEFGIHEYGNTKVTLLKQINQYLLDAYAENKKIVLIIDEAQNLSEKLLEEIRLLTDLETNDEKLMNLILIGQPELNETLNRPQLEQLTQRIRFRYHIGPLSEDEMRDYIYHRLVVAGNDKKIFSAKAMPLLYKYTGGIPRLINSLCEVTLICGCEQGADEISQGIVQLAIDELEWKPFNERYKEFNKKAALEKKKNIGQHGIQLTTIENKIDQFIDSQDHSTQEMKHLLSRLEVKIEAYEEKLTSLNKQIKTMSRKIK